LASRLAAEIDLTWQAAPPLLRPLPAGRGVCLLGDFEMTVDGDPIHVPTNIERLITFLAVNPTPQPRAKVARTLAMDITESRAGARLRAALWRIERVAPGWILRDDCRLALAPDVVVDLPNAIAHARRITEDDDQLAVGDERFDDLTCDLLPHWEEEWLLFERERLRQLRVHALESLCRHLTRHQRLAQAIDAGIAAVAAEPLRESAQRALITAHVTEGNVSEARRQFFSYRDLLEESLGISPTDALRDLALAVPGSR
jgi:DNA-binding SARP family transcriptional activator